MSVSEYPTITATIRSIGGGGEVRVSRLLQQHYSMNAEDADQAVRSLPFRLPQAFFTMQEGQVAIRELVALGCDVKLRDMMDPEPEEEPAPEPEAVVVPDPSPTREIKRSEMAPKRPEKKEATPLPPWIVWGVVVVVAVALLGLGGLLLLKGEEESVSLSAPGEEAVVEGGEASSEGIFHTPFLQRLAASIDQQLSKLQSMDGFLKKLSGDLETNQVPQQDRVVISDHYSGRAMKRRPQDRENIGRMRSIQMLQVALTINDKNRKAWEQLVEVYLNSGMLYRAGQLQREMMEKLGEEVMVEIYGEEVVQQLR